MKRITYGSGSIVTSDAIAEALLRYVTTTADSENSVAVDVTVLEEGGETAVHTLVLSAASPLDVSDIDVPSEAEDESRFPLPDIHRAATTGIVEDQGDCDASRTADDIDRMMIEIDEGLGQ